MSNAISDYDDNRGVEIQVYECPHCGCETHVYPCPEEDKEDYPFWNIR